MINLSKTIKIIKPFDLDAVRNGAQMETKDGNRVILDHIDDKPNCIGSILCGWEESCIGRHINWWCADGRLFEDKDSDSDLVIVEYAECVDVEDNSKINNNKIKNMETKDLETIQRLREWYREENKYLTEGSNEALLKKFPELKEDGDNRFRDYIIDLCKESLTSNHGLALSMDTTKKLLNWIKRQQKRKDNGKL